MTDWENEAVVGVRLSDDRLDRLDSYAERRGISRSEALREAVDGLTQSARPRQPQGRSLDAAAQGSPPSVDELTASDGTDWETDTLGSGLSGTLDPDDLPPDVREVLQDDQDDHRTPSEDSPGLGP